jgi:hypothetical protein
VSSTAASSFSTPHDGTATSLRVGASTYIVTNIVISNANPTQGTGDGSIDVAHLGQTAGALAARQQRPLVVPAEDGSSGRSITFDYIGSDVIMDGGTGTYLLSVNGSTLVGGTTASYYTVQSSTLTLATNDVIRGQATLTVAR